MARTELKSERIVMTAELLAQRVEARFPDRGIRKVAWRVRGAAAEAVNLPQSVQKPIRWIRVTSWALVVIIGLVIIEMGYLTFQGLLNRQLNLDLFEKIDATISTSVYLGVAIAFLLTIENRLRRRKALAAIQELRALAHVVDMHQLSKDPEWILLKETSPKDEERQHLPPALLAKYLDYCSDLLALIGKVAALYAQGVQDGVVLQAVDEIERLTTDLSRKIWQKIMILDHKLEVC